MDDEFSLVLLRIHRGSVLPVLYGESTKSVSPA
jgi:hypothetical protein